jgi:natural product precursor
MTTKKQNQTLGKPERTGKIKPLKLKKQTVRHLSAEELRTVKGGALCVCSGVSKLAFE